MFFDRQSLFIKGNLGPTAYKNAGKRLWVTCIQMIYMQESLAYLRCVDDPMDAISHTRYSNWEIDSFYLREIYVSCIFQKKTRTKLLCARSAVEEQETDSLLHLGLVDCHRVRLLPV